MMRSEYITISVITCAIALSASARLPAQGLSRCAVNEPYSLDLANEERDRTLRSKGYTLTQEGLLPGLASPEPTIRAFAADKLATVGDSNAVLPLTKAWESESDPCVKTYLSSALDDLVGRNWTDGKVIGRLWTPLSTLATADCVPSSPALISIQLQQIPIWDRALWVWYRNLTQSPIPFIGIPGPSKLFELRVIGPDGKPAKIQPARECAFKDCPSPPGHVDVGSGGMAIQVLHPLKDVEEYWMVGQDFDMSAPGTYQVSLGAKLKYLNTTVCSNVATVTVK